MTARFVTLALVLLGCWSCHEVPAPSASPAPTTTGDWQRGVPPWGSAIPTGHAATAPPKTNAEDEQCSPSGPELCFDAVDNNCNLLIDEGCGLRTGVLQFTVAWSDAEIDIDLEVSGPDGEVAEYEGTTASGLSKDKECPGRAGSCHGQNVENVYLVEASPTPGTYLVTVRLREASTTGGEGQSSASVRLSGRIGQRVFSRLLTLTSEKNKSTFRFKL